MNRKDAYVLLDREDLPNYKSVKMLDEALQDGISHTIDGVYVTYDNDQGYGVFKPGHGQTLRFRAHDRVRAEDGREAEVIGYTSFACHMVALKDDTGLQWSEHEGTLNEYRS